MIKKLVNFALLLQDDFTGANLPEDGFQFWVNGQQISPLKKPEGFYVFAGLFGETWTVTVQGAHYSPLVTTINRVLLNSCNPVVTLRLFRRVNLRFSDCELLCGSHLPGEMVFALCPDTPPLKLGTLEKPQDGEPGRLTLMGYTPRPLLCHRFCVGTGKNREMFIITAKAKDGSYLSDRAFQNRHKDGEPIVRAYGGVCDVQGRFSIPIENGMKDTVQTVESYSEEVRQWGCLLQTVPN